MWSEVELWRIFDVCKRWANSGFACARKEKYGSMYEATRAIREQDTPFWPHVSKYTIKYFTISPLKFDSQYFLLYCILRKHYCKRPLFLQININVQFEKRMRIQILTLLQHQFYLCKVQSYIFYQAFLNFTNSLWRKYVNKIWPLHRGRLLICGYNFRLYKRNCLYCFHSYTKF